jgi:hypothetical protein
LKYINPKKKERKELFLLQKEILANGKVLRYHYQEDRLSSIESLDAKERFTYASLQIEGSPEKGQQSFKGSTGQSSYYKFDSKFYRGHFREKNERKQSYKIMTLPMLVDAQTPNYRHEKMEYL